MRILALDISTKAGFAVLDAGEAGGLKLREFGTLHLDNVILSYGKYPFCYLKAAKEMASKLIRLEQTYSPDVIVIEESNLGKSRYAQKSLEFIHCALLNLLDDSFKGKVVYLSSSSWRQALGLQMSKEDKKANAKLSKAKKAAAVSGQRLNKVALGIRGKVTKKHVALRWVNERFGLTLRIKDNDAADAICLAAAYLNNAAPCNGI